MQTRRTSRRLTTTASSPSPSASSPRRRNPSRRSKSRRSSRGLSSGPRRGRRPPSAGLGRRPSHGGGKMMNTRPSPKELGSGTGKKARLYRILHEHGVRNGTAIFLPYDHGLEHGPRDFSGYPESADPRHIIRLAVEGGFNGIAIQIGLARKFYWEYAGEVPLVLKLNGKTDIPSVADPVSPVNATVEEAVRLGADAVGYTLYVGTPGQERDFAQYLRVREDADRFGMPLIGPTRAARPSTARAAGTRSTRSTMPRGRRANSARTWSR